MTLYMFVPDAQGPSTCKGDCLAAWPALTGPATAGEGVDAGAARHGRPPRRRHRAGHVQRLAAVHFAQDSAPGDVNGQGVGDIWYVVDADAATPIGMG